MRALLLIATLALVAPLAAAQTSPIVLSTASDARPADGIVLLEVSPEDLPDGFVERLPALPEDATILTLDDPSLGYAIPEELLTAMASEKDETIGLLLSILITGGGHFYAGETSKGLLLLGVGVGSLVAGAALSTSDNLTPYYIGLGVALGAYVYGIVDGMEAVKRYNAANGFALAPVPVQANGEMGLGLAMRARF